MKKQFLLLITVLLMGFSAANAQGGGQRQTPEERTKATMQKLDTLKLTEDQTSKSNKVFTDYYNKQQKAIDDMRASGNMDRDAMQATRKELTDERDKQLKEIFTPDQFKTWKDVIEPGLRPQRPPQGN